MNKLSDSDQQIQSSKAALDAEIKKQNKQLVQTILLQCNQLKNH
ncbi:hypothetical protein [Metamycoplasma hominis]|nr:hypothetical protein [Metamycoplasma hominis]